MRESCGLLFAVYAATARADYCDGEVVAGLQSAFDIEDRWWVVDSL